MAEAAVPGRTNGYDPKILKSFVERIEHSNREIGTIMSEAMNECKTHHDDIAQTLQDAKDQHGIPKKALKAVVKMRELERQKDKYLSKLGEEDRDSFEQIAEALGEFASTPLGEAALSAAHH